MQVRCGVLYIVACFSCIFMCGCSVPGYASLNTPYDSNYANQMRDDANLSEKMQELISSTYTKSADVIVTTDDYNVLVLGQVDSQETKDGIDTLLKNQPLIKHSWNYTTISTKPNLNVNSSINDKAQDRLAAEDNITLDDLTAVTVDWVVYIMGDIRLHETKNLNTAINGINAIPGVIKVVNLTQITPYGTHGRQ